MLLRENTFGTLRKEEKMWERAEIRAIFCKNVENVNSKCEKNIKKYN